MREYKDPREIRSKEEIQNRNVAVYFALPSMSLVIELHAAVVRDLLRRGNRVTVYLCDRSFMSPMDNPFNRASITSYGMFRAMDALRGLDTPLKTVDLRTVSDTVPERVATALEFGAMSSYASLLKAENKKDLPPQWLQAYENMLSSTKRLYNYFTKELKNGRYDFIFTFNGRLGDTRPAVEAARDLHMGFGLYELKIINEVVFVNELIHSIEGNTRRALAFYNENIQAAEKRAEEFFVKKSHNQYTGERQFTKQQEQGSLPNAVIKTTKRVVAVYPTNDDEYKFIGKEWDGRVPESQVDEIEGLIRSLPHDQYFVVIKMHPSQIRTADNIIQRYVALAQQYTNVIVEEPLSKNDTYALMRRADIVVTFASTIGIEAAYARKPVVLIGDTTWGKMDIAHKVYSGKEAAALIVKGVGPKPILGAIIWGNYLYAQKDRLPDFVSPKRGDYYVAGRRVGRSVIRKLAQLPARLEIYLRKPGSFVGKQFFEKIAHNVVQMARGR